LIVKFASASSSVIAAAGAGLEGFVAKHKMKRGGKREGLVSYETLNRRSIKGVVITHVVEEGPVYLL